MQSPNHEGHMAKPWRSLSLTTWLVAQPPRVEGEAVSWVWVHAMGMGGIHPCHVPPVSSRPGTSILPSPPWLSDAACQGTLPINPLPVQPCLPRQRAPLSTFCLAAISWRGFMDCVLKSTLRHKTQVLAGDRESSTPAQG